MSLITRCPACATMFKVVDDQLQIAQGWVRCGHCGEVFEACLHLIAADAAGMSAAAGPQPMPAQSPAAAPEALAENLAPLLADAPSWTPGPPAGALEAPALLPDFTQSTLKNADEPQINTLDVASGPSLHGEALPENKLTEPQGHAEPAFATEAHGFNAASHPTISANRDDAFLAAADPDRTRAPVQEAPEPETEVAVSFVRDARRGLFWSKPWVRALLGFAFMVLLAALVVQWVVRQKDVLAAQESRFVPWLEALCRPLGCALRPLRRLEGLVIERSSFSKTGPDTYRLTFAFRNTQDVALEVPALEVTLTDSQEQPLLRRVVMPAQFGATAITLGARSELAGAVSLKVSRDDAQAAAAPTLASPLPVAGYRILAFYP